MSRLIFHKRNLQPACGNPVDFLQVTILTSFSTELSLGSFTGFIVEKEWDPGFFLAFNNATTTTIGIC